jgi:type II secretory pathway pseudopilin PulG
MGVANNLIARRADFAKGLRMSISAGRMGWRGPGLLSVLAVVFVGLAGLAKEARSLQAEKAKAPPPAPSAELIFREVRYEGKLTDVEARFTADIAAESVGKGEAAAVLFEGELALPLPKLPPGVRLLREGNQYRLLVAKPGQWQFKVELVAKIMRADPWNQVSFVGPVAGIALVSAQAAGDGVELELLSGAPLGQDKSTAGRLAGVVGADRCVALRWQSKRADVTRAAVVICETTAAAQVTPTVVKFNTQYLFEVLQGKVSRLAVALPTNHTLTRVEGEQIRDWQVKPEAERQLLAVEFLKPLEKACTLRLHSEQTIEALPFTGSLGLPQPLATERETGSLTISAEDMVVETEAGTGLRQVNAPQGALAAYRFHGRPLALGVKLRRLEPVVHVAARVTARLEEARLLLSHVLSLNVEKAGLYRVELGPLGDLLVSDVRGEGVEDWKAKDGRLSVSFGSRVLGARRLDIQLEQAQKTFPEQLTISSLRLSGAAGETAQVGAAAAPGIRLKTAELIGLRELPINSLRERTDELLAFTAEQGDWTLKLAAEQPNARMVAEIFNLVTIGDGLVGGSATVRYALLNQGVQEFKLKVPPRWKNVEFTGPNIRRKDQQGDIWTIGLQDKAWGGYTLVIIYDEQFDPRQAVLSLGGIHAVGVERETGALAITSAGSLQLRDKTIAGPLRRIDENELAATDRAFITHAVLRAYRQTSGEPYTLEAEVTRFGEVPVLEAVADRTQLTTVVNEAGQMLTQAAYMVKNNDKPYQRFTLPKGAEFWSCYVDGQQVKAEKEGHDLLVPLPRRANRDRAFPVEIVYAQKTGELKDKRQAKLALEAPWTDLQTTYAEWELYVPPTHDLTGFGGNFTAPKSAAYSWRNAGEEFRQAYGEFFSGGSGVVVLGVVLLVLLAVVVAVRRGLVAALVLIVLLAIMAAMLLPSLSKAKSKAQRVNALNSLRQIGVAARLYGSDNRDRFPDTPEQMLPELGTERVLVDPESGERFVYLGGPGVNETTPQAILAYSPVERGGTRDVVFCDASVSRLSSAQFNEALQRTLRLRAEAASAGQEQARQVMAPTTAPVAAQPPGGAPGTANARQLQERLVAEQRAAAQVPAVQAEAARVAGLRPIHIEIPRVGQRFVFTKVLNVRDDKLALSAVAISVQGRGAGRMAAQAGAFIFGLLVLWWQLRRSRPNSLVAALGLALALASVGYLLLMRRLLGVALVGVPPLLLLAGVLVGLGMWWKRRATRRAVAGAASGSSGGGAVVTAILALLLAAVAAQAAPDPPAGPPGGEAAPPVSILSATYQGKVTGRVARLEAVLRVAATQPKQTIPIFGEEAAIESFSATPPEVKLVRIGRQAGVRLLKKGEATVRFSFLVKLGGDSAATTRQLVFGIPPALCSQATVVIDEPEAMVEFPTAVAFRRASAGSETRVEGLIGAGQRLELRWTPRVKRAAEIAATVFCQNATLVSFRGGAVNSRAILDYQVSQGELREARVGLPAGQTLLRVEGEQIRTWQVKEESGQPTLTVELQKGVARAWQLTVETERPMEQLPCSCVVEAPHALDVKRETGWVALAVAEDLGLTVEAAGGVQQVDAAEFLKVVPQAGALAGAYQFLRPDFKLRAKVEALQPQIEVVLRNRVRIGSESVLLQAQLDYTIKRAGVFVLRLGLPAEFTVGAVTGNELAQWVEKTEGGQRVLEVTLKERVQGNYPLQVTLARIHKELPRTLAIPAVHPLGVQKLTGFVVLSAEVGVQTKADAFEGLTEVPAASVAEAVQAQGGAAGAGAGSLAYKFIVSDPVPPVPPWKLVAANEAIQPWVRAEVVNWWTFGESLTSGRAQARFEIQNAPVKEFRVRVPAEFKNVEVSGANIRRRDQNTNQWRVELQHKVIGFYLLTVTWEMPVSVGEKENLLTAGGVEALEVERETGALAVIARPPLQVTQKNLSGELVKSDPSELPDWAGRADPATVLAYRYLRPGFKLSLGVVEHNQAEVLQALADEARLTTVVAADGQMMTELALQVRNNGRQFLELALPKGAQVWSAFVAGEAVRPTKRADKILLPLERSDTAEAFGVTLTYIHADKFPQTKGTMELVSPAVDVPLKRAGWDLYLPADYGYTQFAGTMTPGSPGAAPTLATFSTGVYTEEENRKTVARRREFVRSLGKTRSELATGNIKGASKAYSQAKQTGLKDEQTDEVARLGLELRRVQAGNLITAQQAAFLNNAEFLGVSAVQQVAEQPPAAQYDAQTAERQWDKLQQAQEVAAVKVRPLRVNLPTSGLRYSFTQVLQTELNKPMRIRFTATGANLPNWPLRVGLGVAGFLALWAAVAAFARRGARA